MNRGSFIVGLLLTGLALSPAHAQYKPNVQIKPKVPIVKLIPPSSAVNQALAQNPGAKALGVKLRPDNSYIVTLRQGAVVKKLVIPGAQ